MSKLTDELVIAHIKASRRDNTSTVVLKAAWESNGQDLIKSIAAAILTLGGAHAPIKRVYNMLYKLRNNSEEVVLKQYDIIPGFGSSFGNNDPILEDMDDALKQCAPEFWNMHVMIGNYIFRNKNVRLFPNLAFYTAAVAMIEGHGLVFCEKILLEARIPEWIKILQRQEDDGS